MGLILRPLLTLLFMLMTFPTHLNLKPRNSFADDINSHLYHYNVNRLPSATFMRN